MISKKDELFNWLDMRFNLSVADQSYLAQLLHDIQLEQKQLLQQTPCTTMLPDECKHEKSYYCFKTGGGRCRKCQKLIGQ